MNITVIAEDSYGRGFFRNHLAKLKDLGIVSRDVCFDVKSPLKPCEKKLERILKSILIFSKDGDKILIVMDADCRDISSVKERVECHIRNVYRDFRVKVGIHCVMVKTEIEEWICDYKGYKYECKPSQILRAKANYEKSKLPEYGWEIEPSELAGKNSSYKEFLQYVKDC